MSGYSRLYDKNSLLLWGHNKCVLVEMKLLGGTTEGVRLSPDDVERLVSALTSWEVLRQDDYEGEINTHVEGE